MTAEAPDRMLRIKAVLDRTGLSRSTLYRKVEEGRFPRQIPLSTRCVAWRESAVNEWMKNPTFFRAEIDADIADYYDPDPVRRGGGRNG